MGVRNRDKMDTQYPDKTGPHRKGRRPDDGGKSNPLSLGISMGMLWGLVLGVALDKLALGLAVGISLGAAFSVLVKKKKEKDAALHGRNAGEERTEKNM